MVNAKRQELNAYSWMSTAEGQQMKAKRWSRKLKVKGRKLKAEGRKLKHGSWRLKGEGRKVKAESGGPKAEGLKLMAESWKMAIFVDLNTKQLAIKILYRLIAKWTEGRTDWYTNGLNNQPSNWPIDRIVNYKSYDLTVNNQRLSPDRTPSRRIHPAKNLCYKVC